MLVKNTVINETNRRVTLNSFDFYSNYQKIDGILRSFGIAPISINKISPIVKIRAKFSVDTNFSKKRPLSSVSSATTTFIKRASSSFSIVSNRRLIRRLRRAHFFTKIKFISSWSVKTPFGLYPNYFVSKSFQFVKLHRQKAVPVLRDKPLNSSRSIQNWSTALSNNSFKDSITKSLSLIRGCSVHLRIIPSFSFARYAIDLESVHTIARRKSELGSIATLDSRATSAIFLQHITDEIIGRFQYVAIQIPDLLRTSFVAIYFKNPTLLAQLFAITLGAFPRNRKETQFLRFLLKVIKVFSAQRHEILGVRIRFKGRVNRWRRTKHVIGEKGLIPLYTYSARVEIGEAQAITRKGTLGIRIWLAYKSSFATSYYNTLISYITANNQKNLLNVSPYTTIFSKG